MAVCVYWLNTFILAGAWFKAKLDALDISGAH